MPLHTSHRHGSTLFERVLIYPEFLNGAQSMINRFQWLVVFAVLSTFSSDATAGPFRRYPSGSARSQRVRIANALPETPGGMVTATPDGLPPLPPDDESGSNSSSYMNALEQAPGPPVAAVETANDSLTEWWESMHGGDGLYFEYVYTGEFYSNTRGGLSTDGATKYRGNIDIVMTAELDELGIEDGGTFFFYAQNGHGRALTNNHVGDFQVYSNIDSPDFVQVSEFWYERDLFEGFLAVRVGKQDANAEFAVVDLGGDFVNSSFGVSPTIPLPTFPLPTMGVTTFWQLSEELSFKAGVFDGGSTLDEWGFSDEGHAFSIFELKSTHEIG